VLTEIGENNSVFTNNIATINRACKMAEVYGYSFYDSLIIAAAMESGCNILYSEDMQDGHIIEEQLTITNPFKG
jgi:predicted nucleic acid-binding protein